MKTCKNCGVELTLSLFKNDKWKHERATFCSKKCWEEDNVKKKAAMMVDWHCVICNKFIVRRLKRYPIATCSWQCLEKYNMNKRSLRIKSDGYIKILTNSEFADAKGYEMEHRYLMRIKLGRALLDNEHVHHINGQPNDNRLENLIVLSHAEHARLHAKERWNNPVKRFR